MKRTNRALQAIMMFIIMCITSCTMSEQELVSEIRTLLNKEEYETAIEKADKLLARTESYEVYNMRGVANLSLQNTDKAISDFTIAHNLNNQDYKPLYNRGRAYFETGSYEEAIVDYDRSIYLEKDNPDIYNNRGMAYLRLGNLEQAAQDFDKAIDLEPSFIVAYFNLAAVKLQLGDATKACELLSFASEKQYAPAQDLKARICD